MASLHMMYIILCKPQCLCLVKTSDASVYVTYGETSAAIYVIIMFNKASYVQNRGSAESGGMHETRTHV